MPDCPFTPARLNELRWVKKWRIDQIVEYANALADEPVDESTVVAWFDAAGIPANKVASTPIHLGAEPIPTTQAKRRHIATGMPRGRVDVAETITKPCDFCGKPNTRKAYNFRDTVYCDNKCQAKARRKQRDEKREFLRATAKDPEMAIAAGITNGLKTCGACGEQKIIEQFSLDISRGGDGRARICLDCSRLKSKRYYEANRAAQIVRSQKYKAERKARNG